MKLSSDNNSESVQKGKIRIEQLISIDEKRTFLKWFMSNYELKAKECLWLLNYVIKEDHLINLFRFVESIERCPRALLISDRTSPLQPFLYRKEQVETIETEKAFHDIRLFQDEPIYVQLAFNGAEKSLPYLSIIEDNPYLGIDIGRIYGNEAQQMLTYSEHKFKRDRLHKAIDKALEMGDRLGFNELTLQLKLLLNEMGDD